ncbi:MAG: oxygen-dependent coproporphyrinogen oxidase [Pseudomonadota bacterium]
MSDADLEERKSRAAAWFRQLRDAIADGFNTIEREAGALYADREPGVVEITPWSRGEDGEDAGGGEMGVLKGRVFEKAAVHISTVYGEFSPEFAKQIPGADQDPRFWAAGISLIAHPRNPHTPSAHMNTRMIATTKTWFGGGGDLNPMMDRYRTDGHEDTLAFHAPYKAACDTADPAFYPKFKAWADEYFYNHHRGEARGVGGIFYDRHSTGDWEADFAFTQNVGRAFWKAYEPVVRRRMETPWTDADREEQLIRRGRYAEYNLLYDRGTQFGLKTGGNVEAILSSLPPEAKWP